MDGVELKGKKPLLIGKRKKVVIICFYDRMAMGARVLFSALKEEGHDPYLVIFKLEARSEVESLDRRRKGYQQLSGTHFVAFGQDVSPPTEMDYFRLMEKVKNIGPDIVSISSRSVTRDVAMEVVARLRKVLPQSVYLGGGYGPTLEPQAFLSFLDYICLGEGDRSIVDFVNTDDPRKVSNIAWMEKEKLYHNPLLKVTAANYLLWPDWGYCDKFIIENGQIKETNHDTLSGTYDIFVSRGCPAKCSYCGAGQWPFMYRRYEATCPQVRLRSVDSVMAELIHAKDVLKKKDIRFMDSIFGFNKKWLNDFLKVYDEMIGLNFFCYLDSRFTDDERIAQLRSSGLSYTSVGIQAASERIRKKIMKRNVTDDELVAYAESLRRHGVRIDYNTIGWNPFDSHQTLREGARFLKRLPKGQTYVTQLKIWPGTKIHSMVEDLRPTALSDREYESWAMIYQMILASGESEAIADLAMEDSDFFNDTEKLKKMFEEAMLPIKQREKMLAARDIEKGELITFVMMEARQVNREDGIHPDDIMNIPRKIAIRDIKKGEMLQFQDFSGERIS